MLIYSTLAGESIRYIQRQKLVRTDPVEETAMSRIGVEKKMLMAVILKA